MRRCMCTNCSTRPGLKCIHTCSSTCSNQMEPSNSRWMKRTGMSQRDLDDAIKFSPEETKTMFSNLAKQIKQDD